MLEWYTYDGSTLCIIALLLCACFFDLRQHRIPNFLVAAGLATAFLLQGLFLGASGIQHGLLGLLVGSLLLLPFYLLKVRGQRMMGAGDIKLMATVGAFLGFPDSLLAAGLTLAVGSVAGFAYLVFHRALVTAVQRYWLTLKTLAVTGHWIYQAPARDDIALRRFPYALAIAGGSLLAMAHLSYLDFPNLGRLIEGAAL